MNGANRVRRMAGLPGSPEPTPARAEASMAWDAELTAVPPSVPIRPILAGRPMTFEASPHLHFRHGSGRVCPPSPVRGTPVVALLTYLLLSIFNGKGAEAQVPTRLKTIS